MLFLSYGTLARNPVCASDDKENDESSHPELLLKMIVRQTVGLIRVVFLVLWLAGCWFGDPYTESRIVNATDAPVNITITLDPRKYGVESVDEVAGLASEWLSEFSLGRDVEVLGIDPVTLTGAFRVEPGKAFIAHSSLGRKPYFTFNQLVIRAGSGTREFVGEEAIVRQFRASTREKYLYEFSVTDALFD